MLYLCLAVKVFMYEIYEKNLILHMFIFASRGVIVTHCLQKHFSKV